MRAIGESGGRDWRGRAFGLDLSGEFPAPGLEGTGNPSTFGTRRTELRRVDEGELDAAFAEAPTERLFEEQLGGARFALHRDGEGDYLVEHGYFGRFLASSDGASVLCSPRAMDDWRWQRLLVGQLLPLSALLHGLEPLHASAVAIDGRAIVCLGTSGAGKSSVALHLVGEGATLMSDDVTALELGDGTVLANPGAALASVDPDELARAPLEGAPRRWRELGVADGDLRLLVDDLGREALAVSAVYVLTRRVEASGLSITALESNLPATLLGATFNAYVRDPARLAAQLALCARLAETAPVRQVEVPAGVGAAEVGAAVVESLDAGVPR